MSADAPRCMPCEEAIAPGEPFRPVMAYTPAARRALPGRAAAAAAGVRLVNRAVHYACELDAIAVAAMAGAAGDAPELQVEGDDDLPLREKLRRLMSGAISLADLVDELL